VILIGVNGMEWARVQYDNFVNGTANTSVTQTAYSMLLVQVEEDRKKKRFARRRDIIEYIYHLK
jgi:hypothetical protein